MLHKRCRWLMYENPLPIHTVRLVLEVDSPPGRTWFDPPRHRRQYPFCLCPSGGMEVFIILLAAHRHEWWPYYAFMATLGEVLGGYLTYRLAEKGGQQTLEKKVGKRREEGIYKRFEKHGFMTVFTGSILPPPFPFTPVLMAAGIMQYPRQKFFSALTAGRAYLGSIYGRRVISFFSRYYRPALYLLIGLAAMAGIGALIYFKWYRPKAQREERERGEPVDKFPVPGRHPRD
jgi:membrane protein YqaA with SNARE-associated domain